MGNSDNLTDFELVYLLKRMLTNKNKKTIEKQKAIYKASVKKLIENMIKENESNK